ncbi:MAG TPA: glycosyltransferase family 4 protein, partial [Gaiellaceae bacterium]|nr:glycosyltransferase family 4 protein [Gaiellaceae bacterium]
MSVRTGARRAVAPPAKALARALVRSRTARWPDHSRLFAVGDRGAWSVEEDAEHLLAAGRRLGFEVGPAGWARFAERQSVFLTSHFEALGPHWSGTSHRLATAYLHGRPGTPGVPEFDECFDELRARPDRFSRIQVTHAEMEELVLSAGVPPDRVFRIPLGVDLENFPLADAERRARAREELGVPSSAFVVGSFQKDGVGRGEGLEPKLVKGPDVLVQVVERLRERVPELFVLLTGSARGYVKRELGERGIPWAHRYARSRHELARAYHALDAYVVTSRQEGGPKAVLESLAAGVPLVTTRVGQAQELVDDDWNGLLRDVDDVDALVEAVVVLADDVDLRRRLVGAGR